MANYIIPDNPTYNAAIRALEQGDAVDAEKVVNPLIQQIVSNIHAVKVQSDIETGIVSLTNTAQYPLNNSMATVALMQNRSTLDYIVIFDVISCVGYAGTIEFYDKQLNGFKVRYDGAATAAEIKYYVIGGMENASD